jgi:hypothetical protein
VPAEPFTHDVFISYSSGDVDWARRVDTVLRSSANAYQTFFDQASLRAGDDWETSIQTALEASQHLVVLWSDNAKQSDWVTRELYSFMGAARPKINTHRRLVMLNLQGMNQALKAYQQVTRADVQRAYPDVGNLAAETWPRLQRELDDGLNPTRRTLAVPLVVLTATVDELQKLSVERRTWLQDDFGLQAVDLEARYGATRDVWCPFGGADTIAVILERLRDEINADVAQYRFEWQQPGGAFWNDAVAASDFVNKQFKTGELAVVIIDPAAIYEPEIYQRLMLFHDCFAIDKVTIVALPPFAAPRQLIRLRDALFRRTVPYFTDYFQPRVPPARKVLAQCGWNAVDREDVRRLLVAAAGRLSTGQPEPPSPFVRQG